MHIIEIFGFIGIGLGLAGNIPHIIHLVYERCAVGLSFKAWLIWFLASVFILPVAIGDGNPVFITLESIGVLVNGFTVIFMIKNKNAVCRDHGLNT